MKDCCKKWKEGIALAKSTGAVGSWNLSKSVALNFCQDCGSSLKEEYCECARPIRGLVETDYCMQCHLYIESKPKLPEKFGHWDISKIVNPSLLMLLYNQATIIEKFDQLIDYLKER